MIRPHLCSCICLLLACVSLHVSALAQATPQPARIVAPKLWDEKALADWATPIAGLGLRPGFISEADYYATPIDNLRTYPVYHPDAEPAGYREALVRAGPKPLIEPQKLSTEADWIEAGRRVFDELDSVHTRTDDPTVIAHFLDAKSVERWSDASHDVISADGVILDYRCVVGTDSKLRISLTSCAGCHTRVMPDKSLLLGAPCNFDVSSATAVRSLLLKLRQLPDASLGEELYLQYGVPWREDDINANFKNWSESELSKFLALESGAPPGTTFDRFGGSPYYTTRMADLRGIKDRRWLDATATHKNRGPEDVARYGILVEFGESGTFGPHSVFPPGTKPSVRPSDEAMYALALYLYSLDVPKSPHPVDELARRGQRVFDDEGCAKCHTPPLYTNNKLIAVPGFEPPVDAATRWGLDVSSRRVHTDPGLALNTRKGTGYYKVPSLRGVWYRGLYGHSGFVASLEDWFDPARLRAEYVPTGWRGPGVEHRAVPGHDFGLDLEPSDKQALIAFLRTL